MIRLAYGTNGFADHRFSDVVAVLSGLGYQGVSLTLDHHHLDPFDARLAQHVTAAAALLEAAGLGVVVETGARYLLDPLRKHAPTLLDPEGRERRIDLLRRATGVARDLGAPVVHLWSGRLPAGVAPEHAWRLLADGCAEVLESAEAAGVRLAFEPEPGMLVPDLAGYERLWEELGRPAAFGLTLDLGHCQCLEPLPVAECVVRAGDRLAHVQIEDMRRGVHEHLEFGQGEIDFPPVLDALRESAYGGLVSVELPRHSHDAPGAARRSLEFLRASERVTTAAAR